MNILFVRRGPITTIDGISTYILELASALKRLGHHVYILCGYCSDSNGVESFLKEHFVIDDIPKIINWGEVSHIPSVEKQIMLKRISKELDIDVIHLNGFIPYFIGLGKATVMTHHGFPLFMGYSVRRAFHRVGYKVLQYSRYLAGYDLVIAVSNKHLCELKELAPKLAERSVVIPPGINIQRIRRTMGGINVERKNKVIHVSTRREKNAEVSILTYAVAHKRYGVKDAELTIVGAPTKELFSILQELPPDIRSRITLVETLPRTQLLKLIAESRILLVPSIYEAFPLLSLEALALGTPVIASSAIPEEAVVDGVTGFRVNDPFDYEAFGKALAKVLKDELLWSEFHKNCLRRAEVFDSMKIAKILAETYKKI